MKGVSVALSAAVCAAPAAVALVTLAGSVALGWLVRAVGASKAELSSVSGGADQNLCKRVVVPGCCSRAPPPAFHVSSAAGIPVLASALTSQVG